MQSEVTALISAIVGDVAAIDASSTTSFLPVVSNTVTLVAIPFGQTISYSPDRLTLSAPPKTGTAKMAIWIKYTQGDQAGMIAHALTLGNLVLDSIAENDGAGYQLQVPYNVTVDNSDSMVEVGNIPYLLIEISVAIRDL